jgi:hypothetical protein
MMAKKSKLADNPPIDTQARAAVQAVAEAVMCTNNHDNDGRGGFNEDLGIDVEENRIFFYTDVGERQALPKCNSGDK